MGGCGPDFSAPTVYDRGTAVSAVESIYQIEESYVASIYTTDREDETDIVVYEVNYPHDADLLVFVTRSEEEAHGDALWYYVDRELDADMIIFPTERKRDADLKIHYVDKPQGAKWRVPHKLQNKIGRDF